MRSLLTLFGREEMNQQLKVDSHMEHLFEMMQEFAPQGAIKMVRQRYAAWFHKLPATTSILNHRMYALQLIEEESSNRTIKDNQALMDALLEGTGIRPIGERFERDSPTGTRLWTVIWRKIGPHYGVEMGLQADNGEILSGEFFD